MISFLSKHPESSRHIQRWYYIVTELSFYLVIKFLPDFTCLVFILDVNCFLHRSNINLLIERLIRYALDLDTYHSKSVMQSVENNPSALSIYNKVYL